LYSPDIVHRLRFEGCFEAQAARRRRFEQEQTEETEQKRRPHRACAAIATAAIRRNFLCSLCLLLFKLHFFRAIHGDSAAHHNTTTPATLGESGAGL
jgi:hypothetical protein